jgi:hypothetical protein
MNKIPTLFVRDPETGLRHVSREPHPGCGWVFDGEGVATRKYDGTCCMFDGERWWSRREVKPGKSVPPGFVVSETDPTTGKTVGWEPVAQSSFAKHHAAAVAYQDTTVSGWPRGTYELVGPKVNGNPERTAQHQLWAHDAAEHVDAPRDFDGLRAWLAGFEGEGVVWHHPDGRMAKIKRKDFPS